MTRKGLLICGIISSIYYVAINIFVPTQYPGYSSVTLTVSELSAIDAPTRVLWIGLVTFYSIFVFAFGFGIRKVSVRNTSLRFVSTLMILYAISGFFWPPMHQREVIAAGGGTLTDTMHIAFTIFTVLLMLLMIGFGAASFGNRFRFYSIITVLLLLFFGSLTSVEAPGIAADLPTPLIGLWERINIGIFLQWVVGLAIVLLKQENVPYIAISKISY